MPCWQVNTFSVEFAPQNYGVLSAAVRAMGGELRRNGLLATVILKDGTTISLNNGQATGYGINAAKNVNDLRVAYSKAIVSQAKQWAQAKGWSAQQTSANKTTLSKGTR